MKIQDYILTIIALLVVSGFAVIIYIVVFNDLTNSLVNIISLIPLALVVWAKKVVSDIKVDIKLNEIKDGVEGDGGGFFTKNY